jgi:hypothetical protein
MIELSTIRDLVAIFGVIAGFSYYVLTVRANQRNQELNLKAQQQQLETRQAQMFLNIYQQVTSREFGRAYFLAFEDSQWSTWEELQNHWKDNEFGESFNIVGTYYEGIGVLVRENLLSIRWVALLICGLTLRYWEKVGPIVDDARKGMGFSRFLSESEYLYEELIKYLNAHPELQTTSYKARKEWKTETP